MLVALLDRLLTYPVPATARPEAVNSGAGLGGVAVPLILQAGSEKLSFISTTTVFGTAVDVTVSEIAIESFFPADARTTEAMRRIMDSSETAA